MFQDNIDTDFDAGGKVSVGLTATTIVSQWIWAATLLQSSAVGSKVRIKGKVLAPLSRIDREVIYNGKPVV